MTRENALSLALATGLVPLLGSCVWYYSRTVIEVTGLEQTMWIQLWMQRECASSIKRMRRLVLGGGATDKAPGRRRNPTTGMPMAKDNAPEEREGGRFAPPKLFFHVPEGWSAWSWCGWWPVSISCTMKGNGAMTTPWDPPSKDKTYFLTVWLAPDGISVAKKLLLKGRELHLEGRAKRTDIWIAQTTTYGRNSFSPVSRPSRPMDTVIIEGNTKQRLREDAIRFLNAERWYVEKGIPYRRGYLLHGPPGCGKTSLVTALAGDLRLPIVLVNLGNEEMTDSNLVQLLSEIPRDSIVLLEDIDCAVRMKNRNGNQGDESKDNDSAAATATAVALAKTGLSKSDTVMMAKLMARGKRGGARGGGVAAALEAVGGVTLSGLLNAIDGVGAQEGRLLFMTTNHVDDLDEALIRPGRVDARFHVGKASRDGAGQLFDQFFKSQAEDSENASSSKDGDHEENDKDKAKNELEAARAEFLEKVRDREHSFAELQGVLMKARDDPTQVRASMDEFLASLSLS